MPPAADTKQHEVPLCVDLDGTLIRTDATWEAVLRLVRRNPLYTLLLPLWLCRGRAFLKAQVAVRSKLDPSMLPYCEEFLGFVREQKRLGRPVFLVTASDRQMAETVARHVGLFDEVLASNGQTNLRGKSKAAALCERFKEAGFDYAGNSSVDFPVWEKAKNALVVNARSSVIDRSKQTARVSHVFEPAQGRLWEFFRALRPHQWMKNLIVFVPLLASHRIGEKGLLLEAVLAFVAFCLCASGAYVMNDLLDLESDRHHATKRNRPFAGGYLPLAFGLVSFPVLLLAGGALAFTISTSFGAVLGGYLVLTTAYSFWLKQVSLLDVYCLAGLYTIRLIGGHEATAVKYSFWLLVFSMFIFLSLALVKRFVELHATQDSAGALKGRGYAGADLGLVATLGASSGCLAVLVLALYVNSPEVQVLYRTPPLLLLICPLLLYWISRVWMLAHRGRMHEDPIVFALKDPISYLVGLLTLVVLWLATGR
jgi:4-hydroxybenzoate polyprenyltransferase